MAHTHTFQRTLLTTLTLPDLQGRVELFQGYACRCGLTSHGTSWSRTTGRHLTYAELREVQRQERRYGQGQADPRRARRPR